MKTDPKIFITNTFYMKDESKAFWKVDHKRAAPLCIQWLMVNNKMRGRVLYEKFCLYGKSDLTVTERLTKFSCEEELQG